jgi:hypothetical protein
MPKSKFCIWTNLRKSITAGLLSALPCILLGLSLKIIIVVGLIGLTSGNVFDIIGFRKGLESSDKDK